MRCIFTLLAAFSFFMVMAQYPVSNINISLPSQPSPNTSDWETSSFLITAQAKLVQGQIPGNLIESRILVTIKSGGLKVCGSYTQQTAQMSLFNTPTKTWSGTVAAGLLGSNCLLKAGSYELCVQFFTSYAPVRPLSIEICKSFTVGDAEPIKYAPPQNLMPADGMSFIGGEADNPVTLRWMPVLPRRPPYSDDYAVFIYKVNLGQSGRQAANDNMPAEIINSKANQAIWKIPNDNLDTKDEVKFTWRVKAIAKSGTSIQKELVSELTSFTIKQRDEKPGQKPDNINACERLKVIITKHVNQDKSVGCCFDINITNNIPAQTPLSPRTFRVITKNSSIGSVSAAQTGWNNISPNNKLTTWNSTSGNIPTGQSSLGYVCFENLIQDPFYLNYEWLDTKGKIICKDSVQLGGCADSCKNDLVRNGGFVTGNQPGIMPAGSVQNWTRGYGSPLVDNTPSDGFVEQGLIKLSGNIATGQSVSQSLNPANKIIQGKYYKLSVAVRFLSSQNVLDYAKIRAIAYNGTIFTVTGTHPAPSVEIAIIGRSSKIRDCNDWSVIEFPVWKANKDFLNISINAFTNDNTNASILIDNVILCEATKADCDEVPTDNNGNPIMPAGFGDVSSGFSCQPEAEEDSFYNGSLQDLYPGYNGTTDLYLQNDNPCWSIGGTLPPDVINYNCDDSLRQAGINMTCAELQAMLEKEFIPEPIKKSILSPIPPLSKKTCDIPGPKKLENMPFHGRDIIYIHGLQLDHLIDRSNGVQGATGHWPINQTEYYSGYYKNVGIHNMLPHIDHFLRNRGNLNRFIIIPYDCSQSAEVAIHAILTQIREAMEYGTGVNADSSDRRGKTCFARDYVLISHSTGALVADVSLSIANQTKTNSLLKMQFGDIGLISDRCKGRVSIQGAYSGSNLAKIACDVGQVIPPSLLSTALAAFTSTPFTFQILTSNQQIIANSILVDLVPSISRLRWSSYINTIKVPVFTIAGGHPSAILGPLKYNILPGFDDGVLNMDCANGNNNPLSLGPSRFGANGPKVFDMGIPLIRAAEYYLDQRVSDGVFASACTPYLSPTGMVEPVNSIIVPSSNHFLNHFSFVQSAKEHWFAATEPGSGNLPCDYKRTSPGGYTNNEEELVVTNSSLYTPGLIDPAIISLMGETLKDKHIDYPWLKIVYRHGLPKLTVIWKKFYIWKRTYHKLNDNCMYDVDFAYKYLFTQ